jgi:NADH pyrophosphatase NudC (nudix superfamily)
MTMDQELEKSWDILYKKYPQLFVNKNKAPRESCMSFGIECNLGWYELLSSLCHRITNHEENIELRIKVRNKNSIENDAADLSYVSVTFDQVKEKFGGLRIYFSGGDDYVFGAVSMAEEYSYKICEVCGNAGKPNREGWFSTLCENCRNKS